MITVFDARGVAHYYDPQEYTCEEYDGGVLVYVFGGIRRACVRRFVGGRIG
jgi:hypothetical protein